MTSPSPLIRLAASHLVSPQGQFEGHTFCSVPFPRGPFPTNSIPRNIVPPIFLKCRLPRVDPPPSLPDTLLFTTCPPVPGTPSCAFAFFPYPPPPRAVKGLPLCVHFFSPPRPLSPAPKPHLSPTTRGHLFEFPPPLRSRNYRLSPLTVVRCRLPFLLFPPPVWKRRVAEVVKLPGPPHLSPPSERGLPDPFSPTLRVNKPNPQAHCCLAIWRFFRTTIFPFFVTRSAAAFFAVPMLFSSPPSNLIFFFLTCYAL